MWYVSLCFTEPIEIFSTLLASIIELYDFRNDSLFKEIIKTFNTFPLYTHIKNRQNGSLVICQPFFALFRFFFFSSFIYSTTSFFLLFPILLYYYSASVACLCMGYGSVCIWRFIRLLKR